MDAYDRCTNLGKKILPILLPSMVEAENFSDHPCSYMITFVSNKCFGLMNIDGRGATAGQ